MAMTPKTEPAYVVLDSNVLIALCAKEEDKYEVALTRVGMYLKWRCAVYLPAVAISEGLYILCKLREASTLSRAEYEAALEDLKTRLRGVSPPPSGEAALITRAIELSRGFGCSRSADAIFLSLAEELSARGPTELVTFDRAFAKQAQDLAPALRVCLLMPVTI